jgi:hypothetical protein
MRSWVASRLRAIICVIVNTINATEAAMMADAIDAAAEQGYRITVA